MSDEPTPQSHATVPIVLPYGRPKRRRRTRRIVMISLFCVLTLPLWHWRRAIHDFAADRYRVAALHLALHQAADAPQLPAGTVIVDPSHPEVAGDRAILPLYASIENHAFPTLVGSTWSTTPFTANGLSGSPLILRLGATHVLFCRSMTNQAGQGRVVAILSFGTSIEVQVWKIGDLLHTASHVATALGNSENASAPGIKWFSGQLDATSANTIVVPYDINGLQGVLRIQIDSSDQATFSGDGWFDQFGLFANDWRAGANLHQGADPIVELPSIPDPRAAAFLADGSLSVASPASVMMFPPSLGEPKIMSIVPPLPSPGDGEMMQYAPDGLRLFAGGSGDPWALINTTTGWAIVRYITEVSGACWPAFDGNHFYLGDNVNVSQWDATTGRGLGIRAGQNGWKLAAGGGRMASLSPGEDSIVIEFDAHKPVVISPLESGVHNLSLSLDGKLIAAKAQDSICIYDTASGRPVWSITRCSDFHTAKARVHWSADGRRAAAAGNRWAYVWDVQPNTFVTRYPMPGKGGWDGDVALSPDGRKLAAVSASVPQIWVWDISDTPPVTK